MSLESLNKSGRVVLVLLILLSLILVVCGKGKEEKGSAQNEQTQGESQAEQGQPQSPQGMVSPQASNIEVGDEELGKFSVLFAKTQQVQADFKDDMENAIKGTGMTLERYMEIMQSMQGQGTPVELTNEEQKQLQDAQQALGQVQAEAQQQMISIVSEGGMDPQRFQAILMALRTDQALQMRLQKALGQ
ncbi:DUF4168 domain-containing protein [bacterium]|nr:DUF4168 domain-containing protein [bacterium]